MTTRNPVALLLMFAFGMAAQPAPAPADDPITGKGRVVWAIQGTVGVTATAGGVVAAGFDTLRDKPEEYSTHWDGFGKRYGMRTAATAARATMEASLSAVWGEDPRYHRAVGQPFKSRLANIVKMTVMARDSDGDPMPAYSRFVAIPASCFLSNTWQVESEATASRALQRTLSGFLGRLLGNAWGEFWPDVRTRIFHR